MGTVLVVVVVVILLSAEIPKCVLSSLANVPKTAILCTNRSYVDWLQKQWEKNVLPEKWSAYCLKKVLLDIVESIQTTKGQGKASKPEMSTNATNVSDEILMDSNCTDTSSGHKRDKRDFLDVLTEFFNIIVSAIQSCPKSKSSCYVNQKADFVTLSLNLGLQLKGFLVGRECKET